MYIELKHEIPHDSEGVACIKKRDKSFELLKISNI